jgi:hypothetical protein
MSRHKDNWRRYCELREQFLNAYPHAPVSPELESLILDDPERKRDFVSHLHLLGALSVSGDSQPMAIAASVHNPMLVDSTEQQVWAPVELPRQSLWKRGLLWIASVAAVVFWFMLVFMEIQSVTIELESPIAILGATEACLWSESSLPTSVGSPFFKGRMQLLSGTARLDMQNTSLTLEGPVDFELISQNRCKLHRGHVFMESSNGGDGLVIIVPNGAIADFGAEIGISVSDSGDAELHVFSGVVKAKHCALGKSLEAFESDDIRIQPDAIRKLDKQSLMIDSRQPVASALSPIALPSDLPLVFAISFHTRWVSQAVVSTLT